MKNNARTPNDSTSDQPNKLNSREKAEHTKHVAVRDDSGYPKHEETLSAYMISPQYLPRTERVRMAPKRPLGQPATPPVQAVKQPVKMYSQVATFGDMSRIRRPRVQHIEVEDRGESDNEATSDKLKGYLAAATAAIGTALIFSRDKLSGAWHFVAQKFHTIHFGQARVRYTAAAGAAYRRFGVRENWLRVSAPVILLLFLLGMGLFAALFSGKDTPGVSGGSGGGNNNGGTVLQVRQSADHGGTTSTPTGSPQPNSAASGRTAQSASGGAQGQSSAGQPLQSTGSSGVAGSTGGVGGTSGGAGGVSSPVYSPVTGGMGGGTPVTSTGSTVPTTTTYIPSTPTVPTGTTSTPTQPAPTVTVPLNTNIPLTTTVTVPSTNVTDNSGKTIVGTSPLSVTGN
jgi:hypothetical protein